MLSNIHSTTYILTYLLTPWSRVLLERLTGFHLVKKFPAYYGTRRFVTAFTSYIHAVVHTNTHTYERTCVHIHIIYLHTYIHAHIIYLHKYVHTYVRTYVCMYVHTYIHTYMHTYIHTYVHTYIHTYMHTYIHTHIHTYIRTYV
jgi:hypothetical protein